LSEQAAVVPGEGGVGSWRQEVNKEPTEEQQEDEEMRMLRRRYSPSV
jgi:hypothetical protein